jgi:hypothetical protein
MSTIYDARSINPDDVTDAQLDEVFAEHGVTQVDEIADFFKPGTTYRRGPETFRCAIVGTDGLNSRAALGYMPVTLRGVHTWEVMFQTAYDWSRGWTEVEQPSSDKRTPEQWSNHYGIQIADPDGWRNTGDPAWDEPITLPDFARRAAESTARALTPDAWDRLTHDAKNAATPPPEAAPSCGNCRRPFDPADRRFDGGAEYDSTGFCRSCIDNCHEAGIGHRCAVCKSLDARTGGTS